MNERRTIEQIHVVIIDDIEPALMRAAVCDTAEQILTQGFTAFFANIGSLRGVEEHMWYKALDAVPPHVSHVLFIQYDGWVLNGSLWRDQWLQYDYIGAPWPWHTTQRVGNGGFSLRSRRLLEFLALHREEFPLRSPEDDTLCRHYRPALEAQGFQWAPETEAAAFAFERDRPRPTFGFHGLFNWPYVLDRAALTKRMALATPYARSKNEWKELEANAHPA